MHKGNTRVHGAIYLCSKPHNLHHEDDFNTWIQCFDRTSTSLCKIISFVPISHHHHLQGDTIDLCLISIESPLLALVVILRYQLKTNFLIYQVKDYQSPPVDANWNECPYLIMSPFVIRTPATCTSSSFFDSLLIISINLIRAYKRYEI